MAIIPNNEQRVGVFIDIQNLYHSAKNLYGARVNYPELLKVLTNGRKFSRALAYVVRSDPSTGEESFFEALEKTGIEVMSKDIQVFSSGAKKADWDVGIAVDAIRMSDAFDIMILVSGDGDFVPLVKYMQWGLGKGVEVAAFGKTTSSLLREAANTYIDLDTMSKVIFKTPKSSSSRSSKNTKNGSK